MSEVVREYVPRFVSSTHEYFDEEGRRLPSLTRILEDMGLTNNQYAKEHHMERGRRVHKATEHFDQGSITLDDLEGGRMDDEIAGYLLAYARFKNETGFQVTSMEKPLYHPLLRFAGTRDRTGWFPNNAPYTFYLDIKTGAPDPANALQLAGYVLLGTAGTAIPPSIKRVGLYLRRDGDYRMLEYANPQDAGDIMAAVRLWYWKKINVEKDYSWRS